MKLLAEIAPAEFDILHEGAVAALKKKWWITFIEAG
jgi:hypothetical protein